MYLFVSSAGFKQTGFKQAGLFAILLMSSLSVCAIPQDVVETSASDLQQADVQSQDAKPQDAQSQDKQAATGVRQEFRFPDWPQRQQTTRETVPPPPPGPYMSSALSDYSVKAPSFGRDPDKYAQQKSANRHRSSVAPMDMFSPDIPWPENLRQAKHKHKHQSPNRWMPEAGYRYVQPQAAQTPYSPPANSRSSNYNFSNNQGPRMNSSRWMPSMGMSPQGPYAVPPNYAPRYRQPASGNSGRKPVNPPSPRPGNPRYSNQGS